MHIGNQAPLRLWKSEFERYLCPFQMVEDPAPEPVHPIPRQPRNEYRIGICAPKPLSLFIADPVDLVENQEGGSILNAEILEYQIDRGDVFFEFFVARIHYVKEQVRLDGFLERTPEGCDKVVGELPYESHRIRCEDVAIVAEVNASCRRIECGEEPVLDQDFRTGQALEQCRLTGICVANQRRLEDVFALLTCGFPLPSDLAERFLECVDARARRPAVYFQLSLSGPPCAYPTAGAAAARLT